MTNNDHRSPMHLNIINLPLQYIKFEWNKSFFFSINLATERDKKQKNNYAWNRKKISGRFLQTFNLKNQKVLVKLHVTPEQLVRYYSSIFLNRDPDCEDDVDEKSSNGRVIISWHLIELSHTWAVLKGTSFGRKLFLYCFLLTHGKFQRKFVFLILLRNDLYNPILFKRI